jgi:hypothetical protein
LARKLGAYDLEFPGGPCWPGDPAGWVQLGVVAPARVAHTPIGLVNAVELRGFEPLTPCMPWPCGYLEPLRLTVCSTTFPQVDWLSPRGDT